MAPETPDYIPPCESDDKKICSNDKTISTWQTEDENNKNILKYDTNGFNGDLTEYTSTGNEIQESTGEIVIEMLRRNNINDTLIRKLSVANIFSSIKLKKGEQVILREDGLNSYELQVGKKFYKINTVENTIIEIKETNDPILDLNAPLIDEDGNPIDPEGIRGEKKNPEGIAGVKKNPEGIRLEKKNPEGIRGEKKNPEGIAGVKKNPEGIAGVKKTPTTRTIPKIEELEAIQKKDLPFSYPPTKPQQ